MRKWFSFVWRHPFPDSRGLLGTWRVYLGFVGLALVLSLGYEKSILMFCWPSFGFDRLLSYHATLRSSENKKCDKTRRNSDLSGRKTDISLLSVDLDATKNKLNFSQFVNTHGHENRITTIFETANFQSLFVQGVNWVCRGGTRWEFCKNIECDAKIFSS